MVQKRYNIPKKHKSVVHDPDFLIFTKKELIWIIIFIVIGSLLLISSSDFVSIFLSIELQSYGLYLLCTMYRNSESATSAGLTYFLLGGLSSCFILLGIALIYANLGVTYLDSFYVAIDFIYFLNFRKTFLFQSSYSFVFSEKR